MNTETNRERNEIDTESPDNSNTLDIGYAHHQQIEEMIDIVRYCLETLSFEFDRWGEEHVKGPGFYLVIVSGTSVEEYADPMGRNRWPIETCQNIFGNSEEFYRAASTVSGTMDGAVVASIDGALLEQMVRVKDLSSQELRARTGEGVGYEDWMGSRHMNALDTSVRDDVVATITLSEENGRVTTFINGEFTDYSRNEVGGRWRVQP
ncbi:hypothetical protein [Halococcus salsus]|uniref:hypothetical protein n=1 Tax=Halococcus salsus TaxID=2162894 RepID=UPI0019644F00|nr:hypothetical protein [Halococcus salsus]